MVKLTQNNNLFAVNPSLAAEWHLSRNGNLTASDVMPMSSKKVWWVCKNRGCPYCSGKLVCEDNCLSVLNPTLAAEWHPTKNGDLTPRDVTSGSGKKAWWICEKGHEWQAAIGSRSTGTGCPYCSNQVVCDDNCLQTLNPSLAKEWHPTKNDDLIPHDVTIGSSKKAWWICEKGHEWQAEVRNRT